MKKYEHSSNTFRPIKRSLILKKILTSGMLFLSVSSHSDCMDNNPLPTNEEIRESLTSRFPSGGEVFTPDQATHLQHCVQLPGLQQSHYLDYTQRQLKQLQQQLDQAQSQIENLDQKNEKLLKKYKRNLEHQNHAIECLPYAFGAAIAGINPLFSWIDTEARMENKTIQKNIRKLQILSGIAAACGGKVHKYCNGFDALSSPSAILYEAFLLGTCNVSLQILNALFLTLWWDEIVDRSKKKDNRVVKTIQQLSKPIKTYGRLFIEWGIWRVERHLMFGLLDQ